MKKFVVERNLPGAGNLSAEELQSISRSSLEAIQVLGQQYYWIESFIADDKIYCIHIAESEQAILEQARLARFPVNMINEVKTVIDPLAATMLI